MKLITLMVSGLLLHGSGAVFAADPVAPTTARSASAVPLISQSDLLSRLDGKDAGLVVLDVRTPAEYAAGHVPGARNVSHDELPARLAELLPLKDKEVVLYCRTGRRTEIAGETLRGAGFTKLRHLEGDWQAWEAGGRPVAPAAR
jgi:phage shock protein E